VLWASYVRRAWHLDSHASNVTRREASLSARLSPAAFDAWNELGLLVERSLGPEGASKGASDLASAPEWANRLVGQALRIAANLHALAHHEAPSDWFLVPISGDTMARALRLVGWLRAQRLRVVSALGQSPADVDGERVLAALKSHGGRMSIRDLHKSALRGMTKDALEAAVAALRANEEVVEELVTPPSGGRKSRVLRVA
jgi:hypothetical protein